MKHKQSARRWQDGERQEVAIIMEVGASSKTATPSQIATWWLL